MHGRPSTLADLRNRGIIGSLEVVAAIDAYMLDPAAGPYRFASGHSIDIAALVGPTSEREKLITKSGPNAKAFRTRVAEIVMTAYPSPPRSVPLSVQAPNDREGSGRDGKPEPIRNTAPRPNRRGMVAIL